MDRGDLPRETPKTCTPASSGRSGTPEVKKLISFLNDDMLKGGKKKIREDSGVGIKPMSPTGTKRLVRPRDRTCASKISALVVTLVHKGNIQKFTEGAFRDWGYEIATAEFATRSLPNAKAGSSATKTRILL